MIKLLVQHGADVNAGAKVVWTNLCKWTSSYVCDLCFQNGLCGLHLAAQEDRVNAAMALVNSSADVDAKTATG